MILGCPAAGRLPLAGAATVMASMAVLIPRTASAHAFGARYDLPLPLNIYLAGAGLVVLLTFAVSILVLRPGRRPFMPAYVDIPTARLLPAGVVRGLSWLGTLLGLAIFALVVATALFGHDSPARNFAPTFVWVIWWVGMAFVVALVADVWPWLNPWRSMARAADRLMGDAAQPGYPPGLGHWPAVVLFAAFAWIEVVSEAGEQPKLLAALILAYSLLTVAGAITFGSRPWIAHGELFTVVFGVFGRFAPLSFDGGRIRLRLFAHGLVADRAVSTSLMIFVVMMLSAVTFDGFVETPVWSGMLDWLVADITVRPLLLGLRDAGVNLLAIVKTGALLAFPLIFLAVYLLFCRLIGTMAGSSRSALEIARAFVFSLVPIAIAYHLAHYLSFLLLTGQLIIPLASDPFGLGWNLFGGAGRGMDIAIINAKTTWYVAIAAIVLGHVAAVLIGHLTALRLFESRRAATLSQVPMTALMVGYTMVSLWILSQPIVESPVL